MIVPTTLKQIAEVIGAEYNGDNYSVTSITTDTRAMQPDSLFVAIKGKQFDGHNYVKQAFSLQATAAVVMTKNKDSSMCLQVKDTVVALGKIAKLNRKQFTGILIALTGSAGKTTTKSMLQLVLEQAGKTYASPKNNNNEIGVAYSLLELSTDYDYAVLELGAKKSGDIAWLTEISQPNIGLIINAGSAHLETFGSIDGVVAAKGELFRDLPNNSIAVINADDLSFPVFKKYSKGICYWYSLENSKAHCYLSDIQLDEDTSKFRLHLATKEVRETSFVQMSVSGRHMLYNACATALTASIAGCSIEQIIAGLELFQALDGRQNKIKVHERLSIIDDSYNANPISVRAAIDNICLMTNVVPIVVLGDMLELGKNAKVLHAEVGEYAATQGIQMLFTCGELSALSAHHFDIHRKGMAFPCMSIEVLVEKLQSVLEFIDIPVQLLVKGSRSMHMERVIQNLLKDR